MSRKPRPKLGTFKAGDVFVGSSDNMEVFMLLEGEFGEHWDVLVLQPSRLGSEGFREAWLHKASSIVGVYDVYRGGKLVVRT